VRCGTAGIHVDELLISSAFRWREEQYMEHSLEITRRMLEESAALDELMAEVRALRQAVQAAEAIPRRLVCHARALAGEAAP
jgi:hypothetical protein